MQRGWLHTRDKYRDLCGNSVIDLIVEVDHAVFFPSSQIKHIDSLKDRHSLVEVGHERLTGHNGVGNWSLGDHSKRAGCKWKWSNDV